jgi:hypothetical protein
MRNNNRTTDEQGEQLAFTAEQRRAIKSVDTAMRKCDKVEVEFWGYLFSIEGGGKACAYHKEQLKEFADKGKFLIHYLDDNWMPILNKDGKPKTALKAKEKLFLIGYRD